MVPLSGSDVLSTPQPDRFNPLKYRGCFIVTVTKRPSLWSHYSSVPDGEFNLMETTFGRVKGELAAVSATPAQKTAG